MLKKPLTERGKSIFLLIGGNTASQVVSLVSIVILGRLYSPVEFGIFATVVSAASVINVVAMCRFDLAVMLPKDDARADDLFFTGLSSSMLWAWLSFGFLCFAPASILPDDLLQLPRWFLGASVATMILLMTMQYFSFQLLNRQKRYKALSTATFLQSFATLLFSYGFHFFIPSTYGLIAGSNVGIFFSILVVIRYLWPTYRSIFANASFERITSTFKEFKDFPIKSLPSAFLNLVGGQFPVLVLQHMFGGGIAGYYAMTVRLLGAPISLISSAVSRVFFESIASDVDPQAIYQRTVSFTKNLAKLVVLPALVVGLFGDVLLPFVLGEKWAAAGTFSQILIVFFATRFVVSAISPYLIARKKLSVEFSFNLIFVIMQVGSFVIPFYVFGKSYLVCLIAQAATGTICYAVLGAKILKLARAEAV